MGTVTPFRPRAKELSVEEAHATLSRRAIQEVFEGDAVAFTEAYTEASIEQTIELLETVFEHEGEAACSDEHLGARIKEELYDAMIGVMKEWLGEHQSADERFVLEVYGLN